MVPLAPTPVPSPGPLPITAGAFVFDPSDGAGVGAEVAGAGVAGGVSLASPALTTAPPGPASESECFYTLSTVACGPQGPENPIQAATCSFSFVSKFAVPP